MYSGGGNGNGTRRGRSTVRKWTDGRIVKENPVRGGTHSIAPWISCTTETFDEGPTTISLCIRGESSRGSSIVDVEGCSREGRNGKRGDVDSLKLDRVRTSDGVPAGGLENVSTDVWKVAARRGCWGRGSYAHSAPSFLFTQVAQGCLASHFWWGKMSPRVSQNGIPWITTHCFLPPDHWRENGVRISSACSS